jgi:uncharacterized surface protein with fasciclin (FAS1) repeats
MMVNSNHVIITASLADIGVIHMVDTVLLPPENTF